MRRLPSFVPSLLAALAATGPLQAHDKEVEGQSEGGFEARALAPCDDRSAIGFACRNVDLLSWLPPGFFAQGLGNDVWGWTDPRSGREFALMGLWGGTAFVDVSDPTRPVHLGLLPTQTVGSSWRDIKTYRDHAFIVSEAPGHGLQIFDLRTLADVVDPPVVFTATTHYAGFGDAHNLALDEETGTAFAVGTTGSCAGGLHMIDVTRPDLPTFVGCFAADGYTHDAQCVVYRGDDLEHHDREVCFNSNEDTLTIVDVTSRDAPRMLSRTGYEGSAYTHQGWLTGDHRYFLLGDEFDERRRGHNARTYVWDVGDLDAPTVVGSYTSSEFSIDHNLFVVGDHVFQANYVSGLRILRTGDLSRAELVEVAFFDTFQGASSLSFAGAWGVYPFFASGVVLVSDINRGLFVLKPDLGAVPECSDGLDNDGDGLRDHPEDPSCGDAHGAHELPRSDVGIDVEPRRRRNVVALRSRAPLAVAVLGSPDFDVSLVDIGSLRFGPGEVAPLRGRVHLRDVDGDGTLDLLADYPRRRAGLTPADTRACLRWETLDGVPHRACDAIEPRPHRAPSKGRSRRAD